MSEPLTPSEARGFTIAPQVRRLLTPDEIARMGILPIADDPTEDSVTLAVDPTAAPNVERLARMRLGVRRVVLRSAGREAMEAIVEVHFAPFWKEKGWNFPGFAPLAREPANPAPTVEDSRDSRDSSKAADTVEKGDTVNAARPNLATPARTSAPLSAEARTEERPQVHPRHEGEHPIVLCVEKEDKARALIGELLLDSGYEPRFATTMEEVERECGIDSPAVILVRRHGPIPVDRVEALVARAGNTSSLRVLQGYAQAILGLDGDERLPAFLFDLVRFFTAVAGAAGGAPVHAFEAKALAVERAARRMGLDPSHVEAARLAVLFGDLEGHLERLGNAGRDAAGPAISYARLSAEKPSGTSRDSLAQLLDPGRTPYPIRAALEARGERFDGKGPLGLRGEAIPAASRVMAAVDVFFQLKESGSLGEDLEARLRAEAETRLDPRAVEAVLRSERAEQLVGHLASEAERAIVVDPDPVAASLLQMRLSNAGLQVEIHRDGTKALAAAIANPPDAVISEVAMTGIDGFTLLLRLRKHEGTKDIPFIFVSERGDRASTVRGFELGADDFIEKPADLELLAAKVKGMIRKARARRPADDRARAAAQGGNAGSGGVAGSLADMGIVDILQVLASARKTVRIRVEGPHGAHGELSLDKGRLIDAGVGELRGEEAVFELFEWSEGRFTVHAGDPPEERTVTAPLESLLLEACRRRDEAGQRGG